MKRNVKKTMQMLIGTAQKLRCAKLLGIRIDKYLAWNLHINHIILKLNCRISLFKRWNLDCGKLLYNSLSVIEYCCTVWGNCFKKQLDIFLRLQERCARMILDANFQDNSGILFTKLGWLHSYKKTISSSQNLQWLWSRISFLLC